MIKRGINSFFKSGLSRSLSQSHDTKLIRFIHEMNKLPEIPVLHSDDWAYIDMMMHREEWLTKQVVEKGRDPIDVLYEMYSQKPKRFKNWKERLDEIAQTVNGDAHP